MDEKIPLVQDTELVQRAVDLAERAHRGQTYGGKPYLGHLVSVVNNLHIFQVWTPVLEAAAWLHDAVEDTETTVDDVRAACGDDVAALVSAVTDEPGKNRRERAQRTYPKIGSLPDAVVLKLADRIANVESCWDTRDTRLFMYQREYQAFRAALCRESAGAGVLRMWAHLDKLLGWSGATR